MPSIQIQQLIFKVYDNMTARLTGAVALDRSSNRESSATRPLTRPNRSEDQDSRVRFYEIFYSLSMVRRYELRPVETLVHSPNANLRDCRFLYSTPDDRFLLLRLYERQQCKRWVFRGQRQVSFVSLCQMSSVSLFEYYATTISSTRPAQCTVAVLPSSHHDYALPRGTTKPSPCIGLPIALTHTAPGFTRLSIDRLHFSLPATT